MTVISHKSDRWCDLQSSVLHSQPKSTVGTPAYIAPEVLLKQEYDGKVENLLFYFMVFFFLHRSITVTIWSALQIKVILVFWLLFLT